MLLLVRELPLGRSKRDSSFIYCTTSHSIRRKGWTSARVCELSFAGSRMRSNVQHIDRGSNQLSRSCGVSTHSIGLRECFHVSFGPSSARASFLYQLFE
jgi:hypothetical protein